MSAASLRVLPPVVVVTGPTSSGKTTLAIDLALRFDGEIVNADSMQVYRYMDIGTAKVTPEQRARVPHHLLDVVTPDVPYSAGRYLTEARRAAADSGSLLRSRSCRSAGRPAATARSCSLSSAARSSRSAGPEASRPSRNARM